MSDKKDNSNQRKSCLPVLIQITKYPITYKSNTVQTVDNPLLTFNPHNLFYSRYPLLAYKFRFNALLLLRLYHIFKQIQYVRYT